MAGRFRPAVALRPYVQSYVDFDMTGWPPGVHRGLPDGSIGLVVTLEGELGVAAGTGGAVVREAAVVGGLIAAPVLIGHDGTARGVQLELTPRGARTLLGLPAAAVAGGIWALDDVVGPDVRVLTERLAAAPRPEARVAVLDEMLLAWRRDTDRYPPAVGEAWERLRRSGGTLGVARLAEDSGWSRRHLTQLMRTELGITPKVTARILRFAAARTRLAAGEGLISAAAASGYFDQAHLANEWKRLAGCTPREWLAEELPYLSGDAGTRSRAGSGENG